MLHYRIMRDMHLVCSQVDSVTFGLSLVVRSKFCWCDTFAWHLSWWLIGLHDTLVRSKFCWCNTFAWHWLACIFDNIAASHFNVMSLAWGVNLCLLVLCSLVFLITLHHWCAASWLHHRWQVSTAIMACWLMIDTHASFIGVIGVMIVKVQLPG